jgi:hypothetical protein
MTPETTLLALRLLLALVLYAFLAAILLFLYRDLREAGRIDSPMPAARLVLVEGPEPGRQLPLVDVNMIGRAADNPVHLDDPTVSAHHARLSYQRGQWWLEDLGSRNGTAVGEVPVDSPVVVTYGDVIRLGRVLLRLEAGGVEVRSGEPGAAVDEVESGYRPAGRDPSGGRCSRAAPALHGPSEPAPAMRADGGVRRAGRAAGMCERRGVS